MAVSISRPESGTIVCHALTIEVGPASETCLVRLLGELDLASAGALQEHLLRIVESDIETLVIDLDGLDFIDSTGLHVLLVVTQRARRDRDQLRIIEPSGQVRRVLRLTELDAVLPLISR
jgi:anti-sigma B factor antagonist